MTNSLTLNASDDTLAAVPYLHNWFGAWAILPEALDVMLQAAERLDLAEHLRSQAQKQLELQAAFANGERERKPAYTLADGVAVLQLRGPLMKHESSFGGGTSTVNTRRALSQAVADPAVKQIVLQIESPGGTVDGTQELADAVHRANAAKPVTAYIEDLGASAAYAVASQAGKVYANAAAQVGSIGTYAVVVDRSVQAAQAGVKVHVVRAGAFKGMGTAGAEITPQQLAEMQRSIEDRNALFIANVARGRRMTVEQVAALATGSVWIAKKSADMGLIDGVTVFENLLEELKQAASVPIPSPRSPQKMAVEPVAPTQEAAPVKPVAAAYPELKAALVGADAAFVCRCLDQGLTLDAACKAWMTEQGERLAAAQKAAADAANKPAAPVAPAKGPGVSAVPTNPAGVASAADQSGDPIEQWNAAVAEKAKQLGNRQAAVAAVAKENEALHAAFIQAYAAKFPAPGARRRGA